MVAIIHLIVKYEIGSSHFIDCIDEVQPDGVASTGGKFLFNLALNVARIRLDGIYYWIPRFEAD